MFEKVAIRIVQAITFCVIVALAFWINFQMPCDWWLSNLTIMCRR
jgi:protein-S-isoprenylcysteine O-methyltransferase Ste14